MSLPFANRTEAGRELAVALGEYAGRPEVLVLALPRGGLPVAFEVARALDAPLDILVVRKLGLPAQPELAMGAITSAGARVLNREVVELTGVSEEEIEQVAERELEEAHRRQRLYRGDRSEPELGGRCLLLVDDGLATGSTMRAAVAAVRQSQPARVVVAVPVAPADTLRKLEGEADEVVCLATPSSFQAVGQFYESFEQTSDEQVREILERAWAPGDDDS